MGVAILTCEISDVSSKNMLKMKNRIKNGGPGVVETRAAVKFCLKLRYTQTQRFNLLQRDWDAPEMKRYNI